MNVPTASARSPFLPGWLWRVTALAVFVALLAVRVPAIPTHGRFWAEEGAVYFVRAWTMPWWQALWSPYAGYLSLAANAAGLAARYTVSLQNAPRVTALIALAIQALPALMLATACDAWLRKPYVLCTALLLLALPTGFDEVWLNTANSQFHLTLAAALCLALDMPPGPGRRARGALLVFTPLASPGSIALVPLFLARAVLDRSKARAVEAACITAGAALQLGLFYAHFGQRGQIPGPATLACIFAVKHLAIPFLGEQAAGPIADNLRGKILAGVYPISAMLMVAAVAALVVTAVALRRGPQPAWLLLSGLAIACLSYFGALQGRTELINVIAAQRYAFAPQILFALTLLAIAATATDRIAGICWGAVIWLLAIGTQQVILPQDSMFARGPAWAQEVSAWRSDHTHRLEIWPAGWSIVLPAAKLGKEAR